LRKAFLSYHLISTKVERYCFNMYALLTLPVEQTERQPVGYWANGDNCKMFFLAFAAEKGFDPLNRDNWKDVTKAQIRAGKGGGLLSRYKGSLKAALEASFPSIEWNFTGISIPPPPRGEINHFLLSHAARQPNGYWETAENRRKFFVSFAEEMGFDPLQPKNWDKITTTQILEKKVMNS